ncbi:MAG: DUF4003 family protein [Ruminococcaceae bacterium]|nr:DUF4003 family protein [Oscillospiraceae bacterium]
MRESLKLKVGLFGDNIHALKKKFKWQNAILKRLSALIYAGNSRQVDTKALQESYDLIKENTGVLSNFRGNSAMTVFTMLSLINDRERQLTNSIKVYEMMKEKKFWPCDFLVLAAYQIATHTNEEKYAETIDRAKAFYDGMKEQHRFITGQNDYIIAAMLALSDTDIEQGLFRMEELYRFFKPEFKIGDSVKILSQILVLSGDCDKGRDIVLELSSKFRKSGMKMDKRYTLPLLGILSLLSENSDTLVDEVEKTYKILRTKKRLGSYSVSKQEMLIISSALVSFDRANDEKNKLLSTALSVVITNIIVAQQTAAVIASTSSS